MSDAEKETARIQLEAEMKAKYEALVHIVDESPDGDRHLWLKEPHRMSIGVFLSKRNEDFVSACEALFATAVITEISQPAHWSEDTGRFLGICAHLVGLVPLKKSTSTSYL